MPTENFCVLHPPIIFYKGFNLRLMDHAAIVSRMPTLQCDTMHVAERGDSHPRIQQTDCQANYIICGDQMAREDGD